MSIFNTAGNPRAHRVRVYYEGTDTIVQGMPLCYNHDTTTNWFGGSVARTPAANAGEVTESSTTAEGSQNEGKYIRVENPSAANARFFAGVVAPGSWAGTSGPKELDIYIPNGATVPVRTDRSVTINDKMYLEHGQLTLINAVGSGEAVGFFDETIDRSSTAGLALARLERPAMADFPAPSTLGIGLSPTLWQGAPSDAELSSPGNAIGYFNDFMDEVDATTGDGWTLTQSNSTGVIAVEAVAAGGVLQVNSEGAAEDDSINAQLKNCAVKPAAGVNTWFEARVKVSDDAQQYFIGLAAVDTTLMATGALDDTVDKVGFYHEAASTALKISSVTARTSADDKTADVADVVDDTWMTLGFKITGITTVDFYVNGVLVESGALTANVPNAGICFSVFAGYQAGAEIVSVDWVKLVTNGGRDA